ncbi:DNA polymerase III subunit delta [Buchnera aphidicola (Hyadaphis tataricae)]|uniref:DNA polymerase III subunit delta n=1 Tax=Buchnera aphidicola (Hyadaphis tataricae) TaxID=1241859 RepID=A0A4D6Y738_9GAMM|nr:DNA polymerase III subunit delta [Buchnera aphidicola]QCI21730.1 DNA polymerase III subunit delta [Buchnera aphidicola (Hyadaphis tataricae)]
MNILHIEKLKNHLTKTIHPCYVLLGEDDYLIKKNQDLILKISKFKGFQDSIMIDIENVQDWKKIIHFYQQRNLFFKKNILIINFIAKILNKTLILKINNINNLFHKDILIILKLNHISNLIKQHQLLDNLKKYSILISCFTPYRSHFINWIRYEIDEKNIKIDEKAYLLLCEHYEGNTDFIHKILNTILIFYPKINITVEKVKNIIFDCFNFTPLHWINAILKGNQKKSVEILNTFFEKKYNPLSLIRFFQKDLLILIQIHRNKKINIDEFLKNNNVWSTRRALFKNMILKIDKDIMLNAIKILLKIEINIKKNHNDSIWIQLHELTLVLFKKNIKLIK